MQFLTEITRFFERSRSNEIGSVNLSIKRCTCRGKHRAPFPQEHSWGLSGPGLPPLLWEVDTHPDTRLSGNRDLSSPLLARSAVVSRSKSGEATSDPVCLLRATLGSRKVSTEVAQKDLPKFQQVCAARNVLGVIPGNAFLSATAALSSAPPIMVEVALTLKRTINDHRSVA